MALTLSGPNVGQQLTLNNVPKAPAFDPNAALRDFNQYFMGLYKQYGDEGLRNMGFAASDLQGLQKGLRELQLNPNSTPEQHQQAYQQARDTLAQRLTTPQPTAAQLAQHAQTLKSDPNIVSSRWDPTAGGGAGAYEYTSAPRPQPLPERPRLADGPGTVPPWAVPPLPPADIVVKGQPYVPPLPPEDIVAKGQPYMPPVSKYIANMNAPAQGLGASIGAAVVPPEDRQAAVQNTAYNPINTTLVGDIQRSAPGTGLGSLSPNGLAAAPIQAPTFDRNAALRQLNQSYGNLRNVYGEDALRAAGLQPSVLQGFQRDLRGLQLNNNSTQDQHTAALQNAMNTLNSFTNNLKPIALPQGDGSYLPVGQPSAPPLPAHPMQPPIPAPPLVKETGMALPMTPAPQPTPPPQGMYRGGFAVRG